MKTCFFCDSDVEDSLLECPKCGMSKFKGQRTLSKYSSDIGELFELALRESHTNLSDSDIEELKEQCIRYCKENRLEVDRRFIMEFVSQLQAPKR
jgi:hypothetical protein